eukprot:scaffold99163_cov41-Prasinocladus_malaysianus.AAC.1
MVTLRQLIAALSSNGGSATCRADVSKSCDMCHAEVIKTGSIEWEVVPTAWIVFVTELQSLTVLVELATSSQALIVTDRSLTGFVEASCLMTNPTHPGRQKP